MSAEEEPTEAEVLAHLTGIAHRVALRIAETVPPGPGHDAAVRAAEDVLLTDEGARDLLGAAYAEGRAEGFLGARGSKPDWSDVESLGERRALAREESICGSCSKSAVCVVARAAPAELLLVVARCAAYG